jgi:hypothetical protein
MKRALSFATLIVCFVLAPVRIDAHHSGSEYDRTTIEIQGELLEVAWQNPHVHFIVRAADPSGKTLTWDIEANSLSILRRTDATPENLKVGDRIKIAGARSRRAPNRMWAMNILPANGREIVTDPATFTEPLELKRSWVWRPGETVRPYNCVEARRPARS